MAVVRCLLCVVVSFVASCMLCGVSCSLFLARSLPFVVCRSVFVVRFLLVFVCCVLIGLRIVEMCVV